MRIMVCKAYLFGQLVGVYPDPRESRCNCPDYLYEKRVMGFQKRASAFFAGLFGTGIVEIRVEEEEYDRSLANER